MSICLPVCTEGSRLPLIRYGSPLQDRLLEVLGWFITNLGEDTTTLPRKIAHRKEYPSNMFLKSFFFKTTVEIWGSTLLPLKGEWKPLGA